MKRYYILFLLLVMSALLVACGSESQAKHQDTVDKATSEAVDESDVVTYQKEVQDFVDRTVTFIDITYEPLFKNHINRINIDELKKEANEFLFIAENFESTPKTESELLIHSYVLKFQQEAEKAAHFAAQYLYKRELTDRKIYVDSIENMKIISSQIADIQEKLNENQ